MYPSFAIVPIDEASSAQSLETIVTIVMGSFKGQLIAFTANLETKHDNLNAYITKLTNSIGEMQVKLNNISSNIAVNPKALNTISLRCGKEIPGADAAKEIPAKELVKEAPTPYLNAISFRNKKNDSAFENSAGTNKGPPLGHTAERSTEKGQGKSKERTKLHYTPPFVQYPRTLKAKEKQKGKKF
ncbi:Transposon Ty3-G Gag-Pol polyprotein [Senna tora]|uniref:Transposon Ty3-G Gag-Pol polyprotein n=1 Tax=Senna tora TaxID=362788 RepID=A0A834TPM2_9FABA|nr:Transposon Ty3-G Gag-Pol polyprotein [Senna tora]